MANIGSMHSRPGSSQRHQRPSVLMVLFSNSANRNRHNIHDMNPIVNSGFVLLTFGRWVGPM